MIGKKMNILILEDEIYLAQKVATRMQEEGYIATHHATYKEIDKTQNYDTVLLSTNVQVGDTQDIIKKYKSSIIILLVSYLNDATVTKPIKAGAHDYVLKPFMMDELIRKIKYYIEFKKIEQENRCYKNYIDFVFLKASLDKNIKTPKNFPFLIETNDQNIADQIVHIKAKELKKEIIYLSLADDYTIESSFKKKLVYICDFHILKNTVKQTIVKELLKFDVIYCSLEAEDNFGYEKISINNDSKIVRNNSILTINEYVKSIILKFQTKYPDTELSKKLGISRKSLWEKRKKFDIEKKKL
jgi:DNA-binding response OmpR family regulator